MERIASEEVYAGVLVTVRRDFLRTPSGRPKQADIVGHPGGVVVVAEDGGTLIFVQQLRYAVGEELLELVAGTREPGEDPVATARRELQEEAGYTAARLTKLGELYSAPGFCTELLHFYLAEGLTPAPLPRDPDEDLTVVRLAFDEAVRMVADGELRDAKTVAALMLYAEHRRRR